MSLEWKGECVSTDYPKPVKLLDMKKWVSSWRKEFGVSKKELHISTTVIHQCIIDRLHELGMPIIKPIGGVLAWEVHIGPVPKAYPPYNQNRC